MVEITTAIENHFLDTQVHSLAGNGGTYQFADFHFGSFLRGNVFIARRSGGNGEALAIVNQLGVDILIAAEYRKAGLGGTTAHFPANPEADILSALRFDFTVHLYIVCRS
jgi:hypothetical protein